MRFTGGLLRTREFIMKDLYSFHQDKKDLEKYFDKVVKSYDRIFGRCGLQAIKSEASGAGFAEKGAKTYEFQVEAGAGEDRLIFCPKCKWAANTEATKLKAKDRCERCKAKLTQINAIEVAHTFMLGTKYAKALGLYFKDKDGRERPVFMGCFGIGIGRLMATIIEKNHDEKGIVWPKEVAPFNVYLMEIQSKQKGQNQKIARTAEKIYQALSRSERNFLLRGLQESKIGILYDERKNTSPGEKFADCDLIGIPKRIVVSEKTLAKNCVEVKGRKEKKGKLVKISKLKNIKN
jgi:prolyl-tRNA synthetase